MTQTTDSSNEINILFNERKLVQERIARTNEMMFKYVAVVGSPFTILLGYAVLHFDSKAKFILLIVPFFSIISILIMAVLYIHHYISGYYGRYLVKKINERLSSAPLLLEKLDYVFVAKGFGVQRMMIFLGLYAVTLINIAMLPIIKDLLKNTSELFIVPQGYLNIVSLIYWISYALILIGGTASCVVQFTIKVKRMQHVIQTTNPVVEA